MASDWEGVSIGFAGDVLSVAPTWTRIDTEVRVFGINIDRGKQDEFARTDTGSATVQIHDRSGYIDAASCVSRPLGLALKNPCTGEWFPLYRGVIDDITCEYSKAKQVNVVTITAVDALEYFANFELAPGQSGFVNAATNAGGYVFYEDTAGTVDDRIFAILEDCQWPTALSSIFTGNVSVRETIYSPGDSVLQAIHDACDAEFPTVANFYVDKRGFAQFHGRYARFDPDTVSASASNWDFNRWKAGDNDAARADNTRAKLQPPFSTSLARNMVRNSALAYPQNVDRADLDTFLTVDAGSIATHGLRSWSAENLIVLAGVTTGNLAKVECKLYSQYIVDNYSTPRNRVPQLTVGTEHPTNDVFGPAAWAFLVGVDISDVVNVVIESAGQSVAEDYYIEGLHTEMTPGQGSLDTGFPIIKMTADLTPAGYYSVSPF